MSDDIKLDRRFTMPAKKLYASTAPSAVCCDEATALQGDKSARIEVQLSGADAAGEVGSLLLRPNVYSALTADDKATLPKLLGK